MSLIFFERSIFRSSASEISPLSNTIRKPHFDLSFVSDHYAFLQSLRDGQVLEQAGPFTDKSGGAYVIRAESLESAREIAGRDPLAVHDCSEVTVREWDAR